MLLEKQIQITVFQLDNSTFEPIGEISQFTSLVWPDSYNGYASFELWCPITDDNSEFIKKGNVLWTGGENAAVIEIVKSSIDEDGEKVYDIKGRTLEKYLLDRIVWGTFYKSGKASTVMYDLVNKSCVSPSNTNRIIPWLENAEDAQIGNQLTGYQQTGGFVYDALTSIASDSDLGFSILFDPYNKKLVFEVRQGTDRTEGNSEGNDPVVFSTELEDILSSTYYSNNQDESNVALVQGEDTGSARKSVTVGDTSVSGFDRLEYYVDARDLQSEISNDDGTTTTLTDAEYTESLVQRGSEKLAERVVTETFEAQIRQFGDIQYEYGVDYFKGDKVTIIDRQLGVSVSARITVVEEDYDEEYTLVLTFGYAYPTILQKVQRMIT